MRKHLGFACLLVGFMGCQLPPERQAVLTLPEDNPPKSYGEVLQRARYQASAANDAFYTNKWTELEDAAKALEQSARFLSKTSDVPSRHKDKLPVESGDLGKEAAKLREAAKTHDEKTATQCLQVINLAVRRLRPDN